MSIKAQYR